MGRLIEIGQWKPTNLRPIWYLHENPFDPLLIIKSNPPEGWACGMMRYSGWMNFAKFSYFSIVFIETIQIILSINFPKKGLSAYHIGPIGRRTGCLLTLGLRSNVISWLALWKMEIIFYKGPSINHVDSSLEILSSPYPSWTIILNK